MSVAAQRLKIRRIVWTGAIAAVTATGAWYGAGLKTDREIKKVCVTPLRGLLILLSNYDVLILLAGCREEA